MFCYLHLMIMCGYTYFRLSFIDMELGATFEQLILGNKFKREKMENNKKKIKKGTINKKIRILIFP